MLRYGAVFTTVSIVVISTAIGLACYLFAGLPRAESAIMALVVLTGFMLANAITTRLRDRHEIGDQVADLSRATADMARKLAEIDRRVATFEDRLDSTLAKTHAVTDPLASEVTELAEQVTQISEALAADAAARTIAPADMAESPTPLTPPMPADTPVSTGPANPRPLLRLHELSREEGLAILRDALTTNRVDLYLQPIVSLPQRHVRFYEALTRLRTVTGEHLPTAGAMALAEEAGLLVDIDDHSLFRTIEVIRRFKLHERDIGLFCNLSSQALGTDEPAVRLQEFLVANKRLAPALMMELSQATLRALSVQENRQLANLVECGFRFAMDNVEDLELVPSDLADRGFKFIKIPVRLLLRRGRPGTGGIHPAELSEQLGRYGIDLIADRIETEEAVIHLLDRDIRFAQGFLFSPPRPVRTDTPQGLARRADDTVEAPTPVGSQAPATE